MTASLQALNSFITTLGGISPSVIPSGHIRTVEPRTTADLPHITVSGAGIKETPIGIGGILLTQKLGEEQVSQLSGYKVSMTYRLDIWADSVAKVEDITQRVTQFLFDNRQQMRQAGFVNIFLDSIGEVVSDTVRRTIGSATVWKRRLEYKGLYEQMTAETTGPGGIINRIHVAINGHLKESMEISKEN